MSWGHRRLQTAGFAPYLLHMLLSVGWILFLIECGIAVGAGVFFSRFWSQATIQRSVRVRAVVIYAVGCVLCLLLTLALPL